MYTEKPNYYSIMPANVRYDEKINSNEKLLYSEITALSNTQGYCWATNGYFAKLYNVSTRTVQRWISNLEKQGYIYAELIREKDSKQVEKRKIHLSNTVNYPTRQKCHGGGDKNVMGVVTKMSCNNNINKNNINNNIYNVVQDEKIPYKDIVEYLNNKTSKSYKSTTAKTQKLIRARINEGFTKEDFYTVIDVKCSQWLNDSKMKKYLRPVTLFGTKFESYLNENVDEDKDYFEALEKDIKAYESRWK